MPLEDHAPCLAPIIDVKNAKRPLRQCGCAIRRGGDYCERHAKHKAGFDAMRSMLKPGWEKGAREVSVGSQAAHVDRTTPTTPIVPSPSPTPAPTIHSPPTTKRARPTEPVVVDFMSWGRKRVEG